MLELLDFCFLVYLILEPHSFSLSAFFSTDLTPGTASTLTSAVDSTLSCHQAAWLTMLTSSSGRSQTTGIDIASVADPDQDPDPPGSETFYLSGSGSRSEITWPVGSGSRFRSWSEIIIEDQTSLKKNAVKKPIFNIKSSILAQNWRLYEHPDFKYQNLEKHFW